MNNIEKVVLDNGLRILFLDNPSSKVATALLLFGAGSRFEEERVAGISHVLEHMFFKGTKKYPTPTDLAKYIDSLGGEFNAFTSKEYTGYYIKLRAENINKGVSYLSELVSNPLFLQRELDKERHVILQEYDMYEDLPSEVASSRFERILFPDNSLGRDTIGTKKAIESITAEDIIFYKETHYNYKNAVFVIAGNIQNQKENILRQIKEDLSLGNNPKSTIDKQEQIETKKFTITKKPIEQSHLIIGFRGVGYNDEDRYALKLLSVILGGSMSSRMFTEIREKNGLAYTVKTASSSYIDTGVFETYAGVADEKLEKAFGLILSEYKKITSSLVSSEELNIAKEIIMGKTVITLEDTEELANFYGMNELMTEKVTDIEEIIKKYQSITKDDILRVAKKYIAPQSLCVSIVSKKKDISQIEKLIKEF